MAVNAGKQTNVVANKARHLIFFEGEDICYNYKTGQWSLVSAYDTFGLFSANSKTDTIGLVRFSGNAVDLQVQSSTGVPQDVTMTTGETDPNQGGRSVVRAVRPLINGKTATSVTVRVGSRDTIDSDEAVSWSSSMSVNSRTGLHDFRKEGRYIRVELSVTGGFETIKGADPDVVPAGRT